MGPRVVTGFAYINEGSEDEIDREEDAPTFVTHSRRVMRLYNLAMEALAEDDSDRALADFNEALNYPQSLEVRRNSPPEGDPLHGLLNICQAALKWKGELLIDKNPIEAFECLKEAYEIHPSDIVLCKKLGKLALEVGFVKFAQWILEEGLNQRPDHIPLMEPLIEVYLERQDYERACERSEMILDHLPHHERALEVLRIQRQGCELLTPKFIQRVDHEPKRQNSIRRFIPSFSWSNFLSTLIEIIECSKLNDEETGTNGILLESISSDWEMVCQAKMTVKIIHRSPEVPMDIDRTPEHRTETQKPSLEDEGPSRFPLRSRLTHPKTEEVKTWDIIDSFKSALGEDHWESLFQEWKSETERVRVSSPVHIEDYTGISHFLSKTVISEEGLSPLDFAIELMEFKGQNPVQLEDQEAELLCTLDKLLTFDCSPEFHLFMAELLLDAACLSQSTGLGDSESFKSSKDDKALIRSQKHIFKCIEHYSSSLMKTGSNIASNEAYSLRLYWTLGRIQLLQGRCQEAEESFTSALQLSEVIEDSTLDLNHVKNDGLISKQSIESKLIMCLYQDIIQGLETEDEESCSSQQDEYQDICNLLIPVLFSEKTKQDCPVLMRSWKYKGLVFLKELAKLRNDVEVEFRCHLHLVDLVLDSDNYLDLNSTQNRSAQSSQFPESLKNSIQCLPKRETFLQILRFVTFVFEKWSSASLAVHQSMVFPFLEKDQCQKLVRRITVKSLLHLEWCFWRFHFNESETNTSKSSNKNELRKRAFHEASAFLFICTQLESATGKNAEIMENISVFLYEILMEREAVCLKKTAEVKNIALHLMCLRFSSWIDYLSTMEETDQESLSPLDRHLMEINIEEKEDIKHSVEVLINGVAHFVKCLYGVDFTTTTDDASWGSKALPSTGSKENLKRSNLATIWRYLAPCLSYYESKEGDLHIFNKLTEVLHQLIKAMGRPPEDLLQQLSLDEIFTPGVSSTLDQELDQGLVPSRIRSNLEKLDGILKQLEHREVHEEVYYYLCLAQLDIDPEFGQGDDNIMGQNGVRIFEDQIKWIKMDLRFNPDRYWSWECLAINYKQATETLIESCIRELLPGEFETKTELVQKLNTFLQSQKRCFQIAGNLAKGEEYKDEKQYVHEMLAELEFFKTAHTPPFQYPPLSSCQLNPTQQEAYLSARNWLTGVLHSSTKPKWHVHYYLGKISWKLKGLDWEHEALLYFSKAHEIAQKTEGGLIEPFYKLHCARLKLLLNGYEDWEGLSKFDFEEQNFQESANDWNRVFGDCRSALEFCRSKISAFHRVYYQLAQAFCAQGNHMGALSYLQQLFVKGKKKFCIAFGPIDPRQCRVSQKASSGQSQSRTGMQNSPVLVKIAGAGINESIWKFTSAVRKYLVFYLRLLYLTRDIEMISLVSTVLAKGDFDAPKELMSEGTGQYKYPCLADMSVRAHGVKLLLLHNGLKKEIGIEPANQLNASMERILEIASSPVVTGSEYSALSQNISQSLVHTWQIIQSITDFDTLLFSASMELFCDEKCNLISSSRSLEALNLMIPEFQNQETEPSVILSELSCYAEIYSILVLRSQDISLASAMTGVLQQRLSLMKDPIGRRLFLRGLFCIIQVLFQRAERIQNQSMEASTTDPDTLINQLMNQVSFVIKHFNEILMETRFLSLRLMHVMQHIYEGVCLMNGVETSLVVQPHVPLKSLVQVWMSEIQKVRSTPPLENVCIDLTQEEEQLRSTPDVEMMETEERAPVVEVQEKEVVMEGSVVQKQEVEEETRTGEVVQFGGAFASAFQQCMDFEEDDGTDKSDSISPNK